MGNKKTNNKPFSGQSRGMRDTPYMGRRLVANAKALPGSSARASSFASCPCWVDVGGMACASARQSTRTTQKRRPTPFGQMRHLSDAGHSANGMPAGRHTPRCDQDGSPRTHCEPRRLVQNNRKVTEAFSPRPVRIANHLTVQAASRS